MITKSYAVLPTGSGRPDYVLAVKDPAAVSPMYSGQCSYNMTPSLNTIVVPYLVGYYDDIFNTKFYVQVVRNANSPGALPENEIKRVLDYIGATGTFTTDNFSLNVEANDLVLVMHESLVSVLLGEIEVRADILSEVWQTEAIDLNLWTPTHPATNPLIVATNVAPYNAMHVVEFNVENAETGQLIGRVNRNRWRVYPDLVSSRRVLEKFVMEWEIYHNDVANMNQAVSFMGLVTVPGSDRASNNIVGFGYNANLPLCITDRGGVESTMALVDVVEDQWNKLKIEVGALYISFYVNDVLRHRFSNPIWMPDQLMYPVWRFVSAAGGADTFENYLGAVSLRYEKV